MTNPVEPQAVRRVPLRFDEKGDPYFQTTCSPTTLKVHALGLPPPRTVIPIIFVPGIMGSNIRGNAKSRDYKGKGIWTPPNGMGQKLEEVFCRAFQSASSRETQMDPDKTEVDDSGKVAVPKNCYTMTDEVAKQRGWGEIHFDSYGDTLAYLERALNEQYDDAGTKYAKPMACWKTATTLKHEVYKDKHEELSDPPPPPDDIVDLLTQKWKQMLGDSSPLTDEQFAKLDSYYFPVWACGYNWMQSNAVSAQTLAQRIDKVLAHYAASTYFKTVDKVIILTHSMGGLVTRGAMIDAGASGKVLGVIHGVQPVSGAPVVYRRFRAGTEVNGIFDVEGAGGAAVIGWNSEDVTCVLANSPGPMELLPTQYFPTGWFNVEHEDAKGQRTPLLPDSFDYSDPYDTLYPVKSSDKWWGMINVEQIDPAENTLSEEEKEEYKKKGLLDKKQREEKQDLVNGRAYAKFFTALGKAFNFHDSVKLTCHPNTYAHYGSDAKQAAFGSVHWVTKDPLPEGLTGEVLMTLAPKRVTKDGKAVVEYNDQYITFKLTGRPNPAKDHKNDAGASGATPFSKADEDDNAGDGTVPRHSGMDITRTPAKCVYQLKGFDHQNSYNNEWVRYNVLYCLARIMQDAPPPVC